MLPGVFFFGAPPLSTTPWVRWFWSDYNADTAHLDLMQLGAYQRLLGYIYQRGQPLPGDLDKVNRLCHATSAMEQTAIRQVLDEYFIPDEDPERGVCFRHLRAEREMEEAKAFQQSKRVGALKTNWARYGDENSRLELEKLGIFVAERHASDIESESHPQPQPHKDEEKNTIVFSSAEPADPPCETIIRCPQNAIIGLYHARCPTMPKVRSWTGQRPKILRSRWAEHPDLEWWDGFLTYCAESRFLAGMVPSTDNSRPPFVADLEWLIRQSNFQRINEGKYHR
jgi:uncharacterized protein YdaU (DUF1376 family)